MSLKLPKTFGPVGSQRELKKIVTAISKKFRGRLILYRGQQQSHKTIRSGRARPNFKILKDVETGWHSLATRMLDLSKYQNPHGFAKAILARSNPRARSCVKHRYFPLFKNG
jgi:hypothetical protein